MFELTTSTVEHEIKTHDDYTQGTKRRCVAGKTVYVFENCKSFGIEMRSDVKPEVSDYICLGQIEKNHVCNETTT